MSDDGFEISPKYYRFTLNRFLFLTQVLSLQDVFLRTMFYFITLLFGKGLWTLLKHYIFYFILLCHACNRITKFSAVFFLMSLP